MTDQWPRRKPSPTSPIRQPQIEKIFSRKKAQEDAKERKEIGDDSIFAA